MSGLYHISGLTYDLPFLVVVIHIQIYFKCGVQAECTTTTCAEGSTCVPLGSDRFMCVCTEGYEGEHCEIVTACASLPCVNGGRCVTEADDDYSCHCDPGYTGLNCESVFDVCTASPCVNGGTCVADHTPGGYTCHCPQPYSGTHCASVDSSEVSGSYGFELEITSCSSNTCKNNGTCTDLADGNYDCSCLAGFLGHECEIEPCKDQPCLNGGTCTVDENTEVKYTCHCSPGYTGQVCQDDDVEKLPTVRDITPLRGPKAGGTLLTLFGSYLSRDVLVTLGGDLYCITISVGDGYLVVETPAVTSDKIGVNMLVTLRVGDRNYVHTNFEFVYEANPTISKVYPLETIKSGGTTITVEGTNFDVVQSSKMLITMVHVTRKQTNIQIYDSMCEVGNNGTKFLCITPKVHLPLTFASTAKVNSTAKVKREVTSDQQTPVVARSQGDANDYTLTTDEESLIFYLGFIFDGVEDYKNLSVVEDLEKYGKILVYGVEPELLNQNFPTFFPYTNMRISMQGKRLLHGLRESDYLVFVGFTNCDDVDVTDNVISCAPPDTVEADKGDGNENPTVKVFAGKNLHFNIGTLYFFPTITLAVTTSTGGVLFIAVIVILAIVAYRRWKKRDEKMKAMKKAWLFHQRALETDNTTFSRTVQHQRRPIQEHFVRYPNRESQSEFAYLSHHLTKEPIRDNHMTNIHLPDQSMGYIQPVYDNNKGRRLQRYPAEATDAYGGQYRYSL